MPAQRSPDLETSLALAGRWGRALGDAYRDLWDASAGISEAEAEELVQVEVYEPRRAVRRRAV